MASKFGRETTVQLIVPSRIKNIQQLDYILGTQCWTLFAEVKTCSTFVNKIETWKENLGFQCANTRLHTFHLKYTQCQLNFDRLELSPLVTLQIKGDAL